MSPPSGERATPLPPTLPARTPPVLPCRLPASYPSHPPRQRFHYFRGDKDQELIKVTNHPFMHTTPHHTHGPPERPGLLRSVPVVAGARASGSGPVALVWQYPRLLQLRLRVGACAPAAQRHACVAAPLRVAARPSACRSARVRRGAPPRWGSGDARGNSSGRQGARLPLTAARHHVRLACMARMHGFHASPSWPFTPLVL